MPGRLPTPSDFPPTITLNIVPPPTNHPPTNILVLLHGLGDTHLPFTQLARQLSLPETACLSLRAPYPLPDLFGIPGYHWGDDIQFDSSSGEMDMDTGFKTSIKLVAEDVIRKVLVEKCGYATREIMLFGFGQGALAALGAAAELEEQELGGVVAVGGFLPASTPLPTVGKKKSKTPVLVCKGRSRSLVTDSALARMRDWFEFVEVREWKKVGDGMPANREEMLPVMQFFARRLRSRRGVPEGAVEIG
ncbi:hypothetical protein H2201_007334 [Coniosporium apollinis]|uniref:Phospholipase/carboxylesterase/thioesterase domain-containing protein n=2 Tax=Coniosporium TaxID=2810619 RepID=A0ABQ9NJQ8_9PEZI|nr:hypothetical protein H2199_006121 [Cladosporium sp. JES 115]KAJ9659443.1 hypothetical protein H2201_007334 [Coniosporium apollinis]